MFEIKAEDRSYLRVMEQLELLGLDRKTRDKMLRRIGAQIAKTTRKTYEHSVILMGAHGQNENEGAASC